MCSLPRLEEKEGDTPPMPEPDIPCMCCNMLQHLSCGVQKNYDCLHCTCCDMLQHPSCGVRKNYDCLHCTCCDMMQQLSCGVRKIYDCLYCTCCDMLQQLSFAAHKNYFLLYHACTMQGAAAWWRQLGGWLGGRLNGSHRVPTCMSYMSCPDMPYMCVDLWLGCYAGENTPTATRGS